MLQPYSISVGENGLITFQTTNKAVYKALFVGIPSLEEPQLEGLIFDFTFERDTTACANPRHPGADASVKPTLEKIISRFFEQAPDGILYFSCDSTDNKHREWLRIFNKWHAAYKQTVTRIPFHIPGGLANTGQPLPAIVGGILFLKSHPFYTLVEDFVSSEIFVYTSVK